MNKHMPPPADAELLDKVPALRAYVNRVRAIQKNFRRYVVEADDEPVYGSMRRALATIKIKDGKIECSSVEHSPTKTEVAAIEAELANVHWPKSIAAGSVNALKRQIGGNPNLLVFHGPNRDVRFVQQRVDKKDGSKIYVPWTFWDDGEWRCMEPDGLLPLYGLDQLASGKSVMLHEGAKAAHRMSWLTSDTPDANAALAEHPWGDELKCYVHLGWPGGAPNPHRVDWSPIASLSPHVRIIAVADHDRLGEEAVSKISKLVRRSMAAVRFDDRWPVAFDLADDWPKPADWWRGRRYVGPSLDDLLTPATWATDVIPTKGRPAFRLRDEFATEWVQSEEPPVFVHQWQCNRLRTADKFNTAVAPFSDAEDTARLLAPYFSSQVDGIAYLPQHSEAKIIVQDGLRRVNTFRPADIVPMSGDPAPWLSFMSHLVPEECDRIELMRWCATLIARPDIKMSYGVLLISETQGVGKGTLGESILAPLVGEWNTSFPSEQQLVDSGFNSWAAHKRLVVAHEIYSGHSRMAYDRLKSIITDRYIDVNRKFLPQYTLENFLHVFACSNSKRALHIDEEDRRWFVPRLTEKTKSVDYWRDLHAWLTGEGRAIIAGWAQEYLKEIAPVQRGDRAPKSSAKAEIINESRSEGELLAYELAQLVLQQPGETVLAVEDVRSYVASVRKMDLNDRRLEKAYMLRKVLRNAGLQEPECVGAQRRFTITGKLGNRFKSYVVANFLIEEGQDWPDIKDFYRTPEDLLTM